MSDAPIPAFDDEDIPADIWAYAAAMIAESDGHPGVWSANCTLARGMYIERERAAHLVETWAQDHLTVQPSFTKMASAIRRGTP